MEQKVRTVLVFLFIVFIQHIPALHANTAWSELQLGFGIYRYSNIRVNNQKIFLKNDPVYEPIPTLLFRFGPIVISKDGGGIVLLYFHLLKLVGLILFEGEPYKTDGMVQRRRSFHVGGGGRFWDFEFMYYQDIQNYANGKVANLYYAPEFYFGKVYNFSPRFFIQYWDKNYVDYYFGVEPSEVNLRINRYEYTGKQAYNYGVMFQNVWEFTNIKYFISVGIKLYGSSVYESPTVKLRQEQRTVAGFTYKFY